MGYHENLGCAQVSKSELQNSLAFFFCVTTYMYPNSNSVYNASHSVMISLSGPTRLPRTGICCYKMVGEIDHLRSPHPPPPPIFCEVSVT